MERRAGQREEEPVAATISQADRRVTSTVTHRPPVTTGLNKTGPWRSSVLSSVLSPPTITLHLLNRQQAFTRTDRRRWQHRHCVSTDLHYATIRRHVSLFKVGRNSLSTAKVPFLFKTFISEHVEAILRCPYTGKAVHVSYVSMLGINDQLFPTIQSMAPSGIHYSACVLFSADSLQSVITFVHF